MAVCSTYHLGSPLLWSPDRPAAFQSILLEYCQRAAPVLNTGPGCEPTSPGKSSRSGKYESHLLTDTRGGDTHHHRTDVPAPLHAETGRLFLRNLHFSATEAEISDLFAPYGDLQEVHLVMDR